MQQEKGSTKYIFIVIVILIVVFLSQLPYFKGEGNTFVFQGASTPQDYLTKGSNWVKDSLYPKLSGEVEKRKDIIKNEINSEKEKVSQTFGEKIKNYFSGVADSILHPGQTNCEPQPSQEPTSTDTQVH